MRDSESCNPLEILSYFKKRQTNKQIGRLEMSRMFVFVFFECDHFEKLLAENAIGDELHVKVNAVVEKKQQGKKRIDLRVDVRVQVDAHEDDVRRQGRDEQQKGNVQANRCDAEFDVAQEHMPEMIQMRQATHFRARLDHVHNSDNCDGDHGGEWQQ